MDVLAPQRSTANETESSSQPSFRLGFDTFAYHATSGGNTVDGAQAIMLGAGALGFAQLGAPEMEESDNTDYKNRPGIALGRIIGMLKPQYKSRYDSQSREDYGIYTLKTAAAA